MRIRSFTAHQHRLLLPDDVRDEAKENWVSTQQSRRHQSIDSAPFPRIVDFWFMAAVFAAHRDLPIPSTPSGHMFVTLGPNKNDLANFPDYWAKALTLLAVRAYGYDDPRCVEPDEVIQFGNLLAESGGRPLLDELSARSDMASARLYVLADVLLEESNASSRAFADRTF